jgi:hypothetical protein
MDLVPRSRQDLVALRDRDRRRRDLEQIQRYVHAIYHYVLEQARTGYVKYATFWLADAFQAKKYLLHTHEYYYPWHSRSIKTTEVPLKNFFMKRPIPEEIYKPIFQQIRQLFPDCDITIEEDPVTLLVIRW